MSERDVLTMRQVAYLMSQTVAALARIEGMKAENQWRVRRDESPAYREEDFQKVIEEFGLGHNSAVSTLNS